MGKGFNCGSVLYFYNWNPLQEEVILNMCITCSKETSYDKQTKFYCFLSVYIGGGCFAASSRAIRLISWNYQEVGNSHTVHELNLLAKINKPSILFLVETKIDNYKLHSFKYLLSFQYLFYKNGLGLGGIFNLL